MSIVLKANTAKKLWKKIGWPPKRAFLSFEIQTVKKISSYFSFVLEKTLDAQMLFWSVFLKTHKKPALLTAKNGRNSGIGL